MSLTPYVLCGTGNRLQLSMIAFYTLPIYSIYSLPRGPPEETYRFECECGADLQVALALQTGPCTVGQDCRCWGSSLGDPGIP
jgi:hypothetical protein